MMYQFVWTTKDDKTLEQSVPLLWHGEHVKRLEWQNTITLVFLEGYNLLSNAYLANLERLGYRIIDAEKKADVITSRYPRIRTFDTTLKYWFLRWNVLKSLMENGEIPNEVIHLDGDVVLMSDPVKLQEDVAGKTFMLQGCPAFTSISTPEWLQRWEEELTDYLDHPQGYLERAIAIKQNPLKPDRDYCNICAYNQDRFQHDQDMLEYLVAAGTLPQAHTDEVFRSNYYWIQNSLFPGEWFDEQTPCAHRQLVEYNNHTFVGNKKIAFYHFQTNFTQYCHNWLNLQRLGLTGLVKFLQVKPGTGERTLGGKFLNRFLQYMRRNEPMTRRQVYELVFQKNNETGNMYITDIINSCWN